MTGELSTQITISVAAAFVLGFTAVIDARASEDDDWDRVNQVIRAAYFSDACRREAENLDIARTSDATALLAALRERVTLPRGDGLYALHDPCRTPVILLTNLFRLNGLDAELVFVSMTPRNGTSDRVLVYIAALDRYFDPAAPLAKQAVLDGIVREQAKRIHLQGPPFGSRRRSSRSAEGLWSSGGPGLARA